MKIAPLTKLSLITVSAIMLITAALYFILKPSKADLLCKTTWCIDHIDYKNKPIIPNTLHNVYIVYSNGNVPCHENADFRKDGDVFLPGIKSRQVNGAWNIDKNDNLQIRADTLKSIFEGLYKIEVTENNLVLRSKQTIIYGHRDRTPTPDLF